MAARVATLEAQLSQKDANVEQMYVELTKSREDSDRQAQDNDVKRRELETQVASLGEELGSRTQSMQALQSECAKSAALADELKEQLKRSERRAADEGSKMKEDHAQMLTLCQARTKTANKELTQSREELADCAAKHRELCHARAAASEQLAAL